MRRLALLVALLSPCSLTAQQPARWPAFVQALDSFARADSVVGAGAVLVIDGRVVAHHEWGMQDRAAGQPVTPNTIWHWASITKTLTAVSVMQLRDRRLLTLDDPVTRWVPELRRVHDPYGSMDTITPRMLLSHSAGFQSPTWPWGGDQPWQPFEPTTWSQLVGMMPYQQLLFRPGSRYHYSNPGFVYLARIMESITGDPWENYVQKNIFSPLGLTHSYFGTTPYYLAADRANNYTVHRDSAGRESVDANGRDFDPGITIPNSGWNAPLGDLAAWMAFLTRASRGDTALAHRYDIVLPAADLHEMWRPVVPLDPAHPDSGAMGLSFFIYPAANADTLVGHTGEQAGFRSLFLIDPRTRVAVVAVVNTVNEAEPDRSARRWSGLNAVAAALVHGVK